MVAKNELNIINNNLMDPELQHRNNKEIYFLYRKSEVVCMGCMVSEVTPS